MSLWIPFAIFQVSGGYQPSAGATLAVFTTGWPLLLVFGLVAFHLIGFLEFKCIWLSLIQLLCLYTLWLRLVFQLVRYSLAQADRSCFSSSRHSVIFWGFGFLPFWISIGMSGLAIACPCSKKGSDPAVVKHFNSTHFTLPLLDFRKFTSVALVHHHLSTLDTFWSALL